MLERTSSHLKGRGCVQNDGLTFETMGLCFKRTGSRSKGRARI